MSAYEIDSPYSLAELADLKVLCDVGTLYIWHPDHPPYRLIFEPPDTWTLEPLPYEWGPFCDENITAITVTPSGQLPRMQITGKASVSASSKNVTGSGTSFTTELVPGDTIRLSDQDLEEGPVTAEARTVDVITDDTHLTTVEAFTDAHSGEYIYRTYIRLTASEALFEAGHVGALWLVGHLLPARDLTEDLSADGSTDDIFVGLGAEIKLTTTGTWVGTGKLERSYDERATWELVASITGGNFTEHSHVETHQNAVYRFTMDDYASGTCTVNLRVSNHVGYGYLTVMIYISDTVVACKINAGPTGADATTIWAEGAWSDVRGWPRAGGLFDNRLVHMSTVYDPTTMWLSRSNRYADMKTGTLASDALTFNFTTGTGNPFLWLHMADRQAFIGTESAILQIAAADPNSAVSRTNPLTILRRIALGACDIQPVMVHSTLIFVGPDRKRIMGTQYQWEYDRLMSPDLAFDCPGLTEPGIKEIVYQPAPFPIVWFLKTDGELLGMTYEERPDRTILGWHRHDGPMESIGVLPSHDQPRLWRLAQRAEASVAYHVERNDPLDLDPLRDHAHRLVGYLEYAGSEAKEIASLTFTPAVVSGAVVTKVILTTTGNHGWSTGATIVIKGVTGAPWINTSWKIRDAATNTFALATSAGAYYDASSQAWDAAKLPPDVDAVAGIAATVFSGLDHLASQSVYALADGLLVGPYTVTAGGQVTLSVAARKVFVGRTAPTTYLQPLRLVIPTRSGSTRGQQLSHPMVWVSVYNSLAAKVGRDLTHLETLPIDATGALVTDDFQQRIECGLSDDPTILIVNDLPLPLTVRAIMLDTAIHGARSLPG